MRLEGTPGGDSCIGWLASRAGIVGVALGVGVWMGDLSASDPASFRVDILPLLTKAGCNAGACHGAATGQGGLRLSLLGYDPEADHVRITRERGGRRIDFQDPTQSLLLLKGSGELDHEGGRRLRRSSDDYETLVKWLASGANYGSRDQQVTKLEATPNDVLLPGTNQWVQIKVTASLSDGTRRDVTPWALYSSNDDAIAEVGRNGVVTSRGQGWSSVTVRYSGQVASVRLAVPLVGADIAPGDFVPSQPLDRHVLAELTRLRVAPAPRCTDAEFLRRVSLDLTGRLPSVTATRAFLAASASEKRAQWVDDLLKSEAFVDYWTLLFADLLLIRGSAGEGEPTRIYHDWLHAQIATNAPLDRLTRELLTAVGPLKQVGPASFFTLATDPRDLAEHVGRMFLGTQIGCARCHAHPTDRWTQDDYHRFAAYFARTVVEGGVVRVADRGEVQHPKSGVSLLPQPLGEGPPRDSVSAEDRRLDLANWLTSRGNPFFARTWVNRVWRQLMGRGLVEPVDDLRPTNPASHPALLQELAESFVDHGFDLRWLVRTIALSRTYQGSSGQVDQAPVDPSLFSRAGLRELPAQVFVDCVAQVTGVPDRFEGYPSGTRAVQLAGTKIPSPALDVLGRCQRDRPCDAPGRTGGGLARALHLINGSTIHEKLDASDVAATGASGRSTAELVEELYLRALVRRPSEVELVYWNDQFLSSTDRREAVQDLLWTLLNSREFAFNH